MQERCCRLGHPACGRHDNILSVPMLQRQYQPAPAIAVDQGRTTTGPGTGDSHAIVAMNHLCFNDLPRKRHTAQIAYQTANKGRFTPAIAAKPEIAFDQSTAAQASGGIDKAQRRLKLSTHPHISRTMIQTPRLTDRAALIRNRARAMRAPALFLQEEAASEIKDRLQLVNRAFTKPAIVTGLPGVWRHVMPDARIVADDEVLSLDEGAHDLVIHAMSLHWSNDPVGQLIQARRALRPDGLCLVSLFGGLTLHELRSALAEAEARITGGLSPRILPMAEIRDLGGLLQRAGLALPVADSISLSVSYADPFALMRDLRAMGETNALDARLRHPTRRAVLNEAARIYADQHADSTGRIPATFELIFLSGWSPDDSQPKPLRPGSAQARLADALGSIESKLQD